MTQRYEGELIKRPGALLDRPDHRDIVASVAEDELPLVVTMKPYCPPMKSQGRANSCTGHVAVSVFEIEAKFHGRRWHEIEGSERFNYYHSRKYGGFFPEDKGAMLRDAMKALQKIGNCPEKLEPYDVRLINERPGFFSSSFAAFFKIGQYSRILDVDVLKANLAHKHPVALAIPLYNGFYGLTRVDPVIKRPVTGEKKKGYHAVTVVGYDDARGAFEIMNSWGSAWGNGGFAWLPYDYLKENFDAWTIRL